MSLPKIETPTYSVIIPSTKKEVQMRPFLVKEEKILMIAQESEDEKQILRAIRDVIKSCITETINDNDLTNFDVEYLFLKLRAKSVGEISSIQVRCAECETPNTVDINIDEIEMVVDPKRETKVMLTDEIGVTLQYISSKIMEKVVNKKSQTDVFNEVMLASIKNIFDAEKVYEMSDTPRKDAEEFLNGLNRKQMQLIETWIEESPTVSTPISFKCSKCGHEHTEIVKGTQSFF